MADGLELHGEVKFERSPYELEIQYGEENLTYSISDDAMRIVVMSPKGNTSGVFTVAGLLAGAQGSITAPLLVDKDGIALIGRNKCYDAAVKFWMESVAPVSEIAARLGSSVEYVRNRAFRNAACKGVKLLKVHGRIYCLKRDLPADFT